MILNRVYRHIINLLAIKNLKFNVLCNYSFYHLIVKNCSVLVEEVGSRLWASNSVNFETSFSATYCLKLGWLYLLYNVALYKTRSKAKTKYF